MKTIVAMGLNRTIGNRGEIPWYIPEDFGWFKKMTSNSISGGILIMGSTTYCGVGILPNRFTYILTNDSFRLNQGRGTYHEFITLDGVLERILRGEIDTNKVWVCGGAKVYNSLIPMCDEVYVTIVLDEFAGDVFMPEFESQFPNSEIIKETKQFWVVRYWR